jgi:hypothetical protein
VIGGAGKELRWVGSARGYTLAMISATAIRSSVAIALLSFGLVASILGQSNAPKSPAPKYKELSTADRERLDRQRAVVAAEAHQWYGTAKLTGTMSDLPVLQKLIDDHAFEKTQTYELQSLGVAFGDVLASQLPLRWVMVTDEFGTDPTLRLRNTTLQIDALTMISRRIERAEPVDLAYLLQTTREHVADYEKSLR